MDAAWEAAEPQQQAPLIKVFEVAVRGPRSEGLSEGVPHFSQMEAAGRRFGQVMSRLLQGRLPNEVAGNSPRKAMIDARGRLARRGYIGVRSTHRESDDCKINRPGEAAVMAEAAQVFNHSGMTIRRPLEVDRPPMECRGQPPLCPTKRRGPKHTAATN